MKLTHYLRTLFIIALFSLGCSSDASQTAENTRLFGGNLIVNGDAEQETKGWTPASDLQTVIYGEFGGGPAADSPGPANRGQKYFYGTVKTAQPSKIVSQKSDVVGIAKSIDANNVQYKISGYFGGVNNSASSARLRVTFLDKDGKELGADKTDEVKESDRADDMVLVGRTKTGVLPAGTRKIQIGLEFYIRAGHEADDLETDAFADNLSLVLTKKS
jgi:hypothetical protein